MRKTFGLAALAMVAFASNSLLNRLALQSASIDALSYSAIRLASGAAMLVLVVLFARKGLKGSPHSAVCLLVYTLAFSLAYLHLSAGIGALILFGSVQMTMMGWGIRTGERLSGWGWAGFALAFGGLATLLAPAGQGASALPAASMVLAGVAWGIYSIRGRATTEPLSDTAGNFVWAMLLPLLLMAIQPGSVQISGYGAMLAVISGALTSGLGYVIWYAALRELTSLKAAVVQLSVPAIAAIGGVVLLGEPVSLRLVLSAAAILGGIALSLLAKSSAGPSSAS